MKELPSDGPGTFAEAAGYAAREFVRAWAVPVTHARYTATNGEAGEAHAFLIHHQSAVGFDGTNTSLPFTANVSLIEASGLSDDIVVG